MHCINSVLMRFPDAPSRPPPPERSTEPHSDEYYQHDIEADMRAAGLQHVHTVESDPRHRVVVSRECWARCLLKCLNQWSWDAYGCTLRGVRGGKAESSVVANGNAVESIYCSVLMQAHPVVPQDASPNLATSPALPMQLGHL